MNTKGMTKYLIMVMLMASINIPLFIYSRSFLKSEQPGMEAFDAYIAPAKAHAQAQPDEQTNPKDKPQDAPLAESVAMDEKPAVKAEPPPLANLYRPPLLGKCKKLFESFMRENDPAKPFRAFVYSFDGETAYCAGAVTDKSKKRQKKLQGKTVKKTKPAPASTLLAVFTHQKKLTR